MSECLDDQLDRVVRNVFDRRLAQNYLALFYQSHVTKGVLGKVAQECSTVRLYTSSQDMRLVGTCSARQLHFVQRAELVSYKEHWTDLERRGKSFGCLVT